MSGSFLQLLLARPQPFPVSDPLRAPRVTQLAPTRRKQAPAFLAAARPWTAGHEHISAPMLKNCGQHRGAVADHVGDGESPGAAHDQRVGIIRSGAAVNLSGAAGNWSASPRSISLPSFAAASVVSRTRPV